MIDLKEIDKTIELWNSIPNNPPTWDKEEVDWTEDDWTFNCRFALWDGFKSSGKSIVCPKLEVIK